MRNKSFARFQIFLLLIVVALVIWRMNKGPATGVGFVSLAGLDLAALYERHFEVKEESVLYVNAVGAFENDARSARLAAYPWIVNRSTNEVVWQPN